MIRFRIAVVVDPICRYERQASASYIIPEMLFLTASPRVRLNHLADRPLISSDPSAAAPSTSSRIRSMTSAANASLTAQTAPAAPPSNSALNDCQFSAA
jgi:hypothetical protein